MSSELIDVDLIVREVLLRLKQGAIPAAVTPRQLQLSDRVISLELVAGKLQGQQELHVLSHAVVTPAVLDELKQRQIRLVRQNSLEIAEASWPTKTVPSRMNLWILNGGTFSTTALLGDLSSRFEVGQIPQTKDWATDLQQLASNLEQEATSSMAVICCSAPERITWMAHEHRPLRAFMAVDRQNVERGVETMDANVLVLGTGKSSPLMECRTLIRHFVQHREAKPLGSLTAR